MTIDEADHMTDFGSPGPDRPRALTGEVPTFALPVSDAVVRATLRWKAIARRRFRADTPISVTLSCLWECVDGSRGTISREGDQVGGPHGGVPLVWIDDAAPGRGERRNDSVLIDLSRLDEIRRLLIVADMSDGQVQWDVAGAVLTITDPGVADVDLAIGPGAARLCAVALLGRFNDQLVIQREMQFLSDSDALRGLYSWQPAGPAATPAVTPAAAAPETLPRETPPLEAPPSDIEPPAIGLVAAQPDTTQADTAQADTAQADTAQADTAQAVAPVETVAEVDQLEIERAEEARVEAERVETAGVEAERVEAARLEADRVETERVEAERVEAERVEAKRVETGRVEAARVEAARVEAERVEAKRVEAGRVEAERLEAERLEAERQEIAQLEADRLEAQRAELLEIERQAELLEAELAEAEAIAEMRRAAAAQRAAEATRLAEEANRSEASRIALAKERAEARRKAEVEKQAQASQKAEAQRQAEAERVEAERVEAERQAEVSQKAEAQRQAEAERVEAERVEAERQAEAERNQQAEAQRQAEAERKAAAAAIRPRPSRQDNGHHVLAEPAVLVEPAAVVESSPSPVAAAHVLTEQDADAVVSAASDMLKLSVRSDAPARRTFRRSKPVSLDLGCLYEFADGSKGVVQHLGNATVSESDTVTGPPIIALVHAAAGETLTVDLKRRAEIVRLLVFAYIYDGDPDWRAASATLELAPDTGPRIELAVDRNPTLARFCALALITPTDKGVVVKREVKFVEGTQRHVDHAYHWGLEWTPGRK